MEIKSYGNQLTLIKEGEILINRIPQEKQVPNPPPNPEYE